MVNTGAKSTQTSLHWCHFQNEFFYQNFLRSSNISYVYLEWKESVIFQMKSKLDCQGWSRVAGSWIRNENLSKRTLARHLPIHLELLSYIQAIQLPSVSCIAEEFISVRDFLSNYPLIYFGLLRLKSVWRWTMKFWESSSQQIIILVMQRETQSDQMTHSLHLKKFFWQQRRGERIWSW